ncbi:MAG: FAD-dependent monooxygenase [Hassallia sp. WJT32-NPBG1]|jgi:2-polyprenyl-6-methoxyphenol hydroxylase-like FAD-dependent oxidoreductase|nr:FAD-dependent monooxygenase [Hassallia sp. WJT32-NPBG1]
MFPKANCSSNIGSHALVIGGSMAGLLAGRILANHFDRVTIIERDKFPEGPVPRKSTPQTSHLHTLLLRGQIFLEHLFPGLRDEMIAAGAPLMDMAADIAWLNPAGWGVRCPSNLTLLAFSRDWLDWNVRRRLAAFTQICFLEEAEVTGLLSNAAGTGVVGVQVRFCNRSERRTTSEERLLADLVVDASGRRSKAPQWLEALGYMPPQETVVNAFLGYASRAYQCPFDFQSDWTGVLIQAAPPTRTRAGLLSPVEGNRWLVTLAGGDRDYPPTDDAGFLDFVRSLPNTIIYDAIKNAEPLSPIYGYRTTENRLRHYERLPRQPEGFVVVGDAVCAFNPVYGQGMTTAILGALTLEDCLQKQRWHRADSELTGLARRFQKKLVKVNAVPWLLATNEDYRYLGTEGKTPNWTTRLMHWYMDQVMLLTTEHTNVRLVLLEVMHLLKPPAALFHPGIIAQILRQALKRTLWQRKDSANLTATKLDY